MKRQPREAYEFDRVQSPFAMAVDEILTRYPDMLPGTAMQCVTFRGSINWRLAHEFGDGRRLSDDHPRAPALPQERLATKKATKPRTTNGFSSEGKFTSAAMNVLKSMPRCKFWRANVGRARGVSFGEAGQPDIMGLLAGGRFIGIELKQVGGKLSSVQEKWHREARSLGCIVLVCETMESVVREVGNAIKGIE